MPQRDPSRMTAWQWRKFQYEWLTWFDKKWEACR